MTYKTEGWMITKHVIVCDGYCGLALSADSKFDVYAALGAEGWSTFERWNGYEYVTRHYCPSCLDDERWRDDGFEWEHRL